MTAASQKKSGVAEVWHPPRHLSHRERLTQVSNACKETCLSEGEATVPGRDSPGIQVPLEKVRGGVSDGPHPSFTLS